MREIRIYFVDFWKGFQIEDNFILSALKNQYQVIIDPHHPDYLFYSLYGNDHFRYKNAIKIYFTGENDIPDFNLCDYGIGGVQWNLEDRYFRLPLYALSDGYEDILVETRLTASLQQPYTHRKFCNFVYSNKQKADPIREEFFHRLSQYKKVDSGGKYLNNIGGPVADKIDFIKDYKFTIAFENSSVPGYTTEKLVDPMRVNSLPVYWGNPDVENDFNTKSFINVPDYQSMEEAIEEIIRLDTDAEAYLDKLTQPWIEKDRIIDFRSQLADFLGAVIEWPLNRAKRIPDYGYCYYYANKQRIGNSVYKNNFLRPVLKRIIN
ncbi:MAG: glycosyltransferase [Candidatus Symbiothrix sp.]|jgi:hypothetical protein|nr:glycosyltransferase [Candidatus Symbiothrix sp.]